MERTAHCACGRVSITVHNDPPFVATCHCDFCQKRTGSVFQVGAYFSPDEQLDITGETTVYNGLEIDGVGTSSGNSVSYHFCPTCGSTMYWVIGGLLPSIAMPVGNFVDIDFPSPTIEFHTELRHHWVPEIPGAQQINESTSP